MKPEERKAAQPASTRRDAEIELEREATKLLVESLKTAGRGEYPFYSAGYLRRMTTMDERMLCEDEAPPPKAPGTATAVIWRLARKARLGPLETDALRIAMEGGSVAETAEVLGIKRSRVRALLRRATEKMRQHAAEVEESFHEQVVDIIAEDQKRRPYRREKHCKPGQELCRRTGICCRRWYILNADD